MCFISYVLLLLSHMMERQITTKYIEDLLDAIITLATSGIPCTCDGASAMV